MADYKVDNNSSTDSDDDDYIGCKRKNRPSSSSSSSSPINLSKTTIPKRKKTRKLVKKIKLSDLVVPQYPNWGRQRQKQVFDDAPVTSKLAQSVNKWAANWNERCEISKKEFQRRKYVLTKCLYIMYDDDVGYAYGPEIVAEVAGFFRQTWTKKDGIMTSDGMPIYIRDTVFVILEIIEKYLASDYKSSEDIIKIFEKLQEISDYHFKKRKRTQIFRHINYRHSKDQETQFDKELQHIETKLLSQCKCASKKNTKCYNTSFKFVR